MKLIKINGYWSAVDSEQTAYTPANVVLRSLGDVHDEYNINTGVLTQRIDDDGESVLDDPIITQYSAQSLMSCPNGTIYVEPAVADAGIYTDRMSILHQNLPIRQLKKLSKIDFSTGVETELDMSQAVIAENKLSFMHPELFEGDIVFFVYEYDSKSTIPEIEAEYYDSRYVKKDAVTNKFYRWDLVVSNGQWDIALTEVV